MEFGKRIQMRADRWFEYKRMGAKYGTHEGAMAMLWQFKCLGIHDSDLDDGYENLGCGVVNGVLLAADTEPEAVEELRKHLMHLSEEYENTHWELTLVGIDARPYGSDTIVHESHSFM